MPTAAFAPKAALISLATSASQRICRRMFLLHGKCCIPAQFETLSSIFSNTGIIKRHGVKPFEWYLERRGWP